MCELFAMSSAVPTIVSFSLEEFSRHGGLTDQHGDGWGIAFYDDHDVRIVKEESSASDSAILEFVRNHSFRSNRVISHIRQATQGQVSVKNTQPFSRELGGRMHVFAHNGDLINIEQSETIMGRFMPVGSTDSEYAFCLLMEMLAEVEPKPSDKTLDLAERYELVSLFAKKMRTYGVANFIYSDSEYLYIHGHERTKSGGIEFELPGLYTLCRTCKKDKDAVPIKGLEVRDKPDSQKVILVASVPLTDEVWIPLSEGELKVIKDGKEILPFSEALVS